MKTMRLSTSALPFVALVICTSGCDGASSTPTSSSGSSTEQPAPAKTTTPPYTGPSDSANPDPTPPPVNCTGNPGELYELTVPTLEAADQVKLCAYRGRVILIVNGASGCGYTPQYAPLEKLYAKYKETQKKPFEVLAFPSKSFNQEKDTDKEVSTFCTTEYHITFPLFTIAPVIDNAAKNETAQPVYKWLYAQPGMATPVAWNFEKFLIGKDGKVVKRWLSAVSPDEGSEIDMAIQAELAK